MRYLNILRLMTFLYLRVPMVAVKVTNEQLFINQERQLLEMMESLSINLPKELNVFREVENSLLSSIPRLPLSIYRIDF
ncbi:hypothetical protein PN36_21850 [Candidatus Thiomargarita nelsonii]|uniref:Uncharacterized protein n=1 Tax=Candidatus Thiomargarita nelsonii TaxID=1003181 RepID=A0A0A6PLD7_9GAMM|nr:hypothetical protein PN36_21850 [Candidatus Thiomargarita nelsonii]